MVQNSPLLSVIMPNLNKGEYVRDAIGSILGQSYDNFELHFVDNGSSDKSRDIAKGFAAQDKRVVLLDEPRRGRSYARNRGIKEARGDLITFPDSDDVSHEHRLEEQVNLLVRHPEYGACHTNGWIIDRFGKPTGEVYHKDIVPLPTEGYQGSVFHQLLVRNFVIGPSVMLRRSCIPSGLYDARLAAAQDWDFTLRLANRHQFGYLPEPLYGYRIHPGSVPWSLQLSFHPLIYRKCLESLNLTEEDREVVVRRLLRLYRGNRSYGRLIWLLMKERSARKEALEHLGRKPSDATRAS